MTNKNKQVADTQEEFQGGAPLGLPSEPVEEKTKTFDPPLDITSPEASEKEAPIETELEEVDPEEVVEFDDIPSGVEPTVEAVPSDKVLVRCPDCPWKPGLKDEYTPCSTCNGTGKVEAEPLE